MNRIVGTLAFVTLAALAGCINDDPTLAGGGGGGQVSKPSGVSPSSQQQVNTPIGTQPGDDPAGRGRTEGKFSEVLKNPPATPGLCVDCTVRVDHDIYEASPGVFEDTMTVFGPEAELCQLAVRRFGQTHQFEYDTCEWFQHL